MAIYAVGDIQGCYDPLCRLLDQAHFDPAVDRLWAVGDLVNRGPKSLKTLRFLKSLGGSFTAVLGNHDLHLLALATGAHTEGKISSLQQVLDAPDCGELCEWIRQLPLLHYEKVSTTTGPQDFLMVHAGLAPGWSLQDALGYAAEVEAMLRSANYKKFLKQMYGDKPDTWDEKLKGMKRLRLITNYLTRVRFCNEQGRLNLVVKTKADTAPRGYQPWYTYQRLNQQMVILFGHWATLHGVTNTPNIHALDTGCVWGRCLSMLRLSDQQLICTDC
ncbi:MAG: symmetrical bis(5'-nucleosyl)-tetraphosphatase [Pseudomonadales bacterium]|nr:symmetrical bis(5'-nucleosyl)-tetraphosphatase [Pseudomonadales bacterium]